jgi:hypothetical protein
MGGLSSTKGFLLAAALTLVLAVGCGGSSGSDEVSVQTGSLSKAQFISKAGAICKKTHAQLVGEYGAAIKTNQSAAGDAQKERELLGEVVETVVVPNIEGEIEQISTLGAPAAYAPEAASFLKAVHTQLDEIRANPTQLTATSFPFKDAQKIAQKAGMRVCAESFG